MSDKRRVTVYLTPSVYDEAMKLSNRLGVSFSGLVNVALNEYIKQDSVIDLVSVFDELRKISDSK